MIGKHSKVLLAVFLVVVSGLMGCTDRDAGERAKPLVVQFGWLFDAHHLGFLWAERSGYYANCGLDVRLLPGGLDSSPAKAVLGGAADIGQFSGPEQLFTSRAEGLPVVAIAAFHRKSPHAIISLDRMPIRSAEDLAGRTIAVAFGDSGEVNFRSLLLRSRISEDQVRIVPFRFDLTPLMRGDVDAVTGFATDQPATLQEQGYHPVVFPYSDAGLNSYGYMFFIKEGTSRRSHTQLACFLTASRRGWSEVFESPDEPLAYLCNERLPDLSCTAEAEKLRLLRPIMLTVDGELATWRMSSEGLVQAEEQLVTFGQLERSSPVTSAFDNASITEAEAVSATQ